MILTVTANPATDIVYFVDEFKMGEVHRPFKMTCSAGGKGINVSKVASIMGESVTAMGFVGGNNGAFIQSEMEKLGIKNMFTEIKGETRKCVNISDASGKSGEILESGPEISKDEEERFLKTYTDEIKNHSIICISGSLPRGLESSFYIKLTELAKQNGKKIMVDTGGKVLEDIISARPYMIKPNRDELSNLIGRELAEDSDIKDALKMLRDKGVEIPFVTLGGDGAMLYDGEKFYKFRIPSVKVKNAVGSGDSTLAGISVGLCRKMELCDAVRTGMAAGVANTQFEQTGIVSKELIDKFYREIIIEEI